MRKIIGKNSYANRSTNAYTDINKAKSAQSTQSMVPAQYSPEFKGDMFSGCSQVIVVTCSNMNTIYATLTTYQKNRSEWVKRSIMDARVGKYGLIVSKET
jgi:L,D-peptidoglycan transpeptidase YkuD (ErfK/YbiS/YcfS/YnhG family)